MLVQRVLLPVFVLVGLAFALLLGMVAARGTPRGNPGLARGSQWPPARSSAIASATSSKCLCCFIS